MTGEPVRVGIVGTGTIVAAYIETLRRIPTVELVAMADAEPRRAQAVAATVPRCRAVSVSELVTIPEIELVVNLTPPLAHASVTENALASGHHVYSEKPLAVDREDAARLVHLAGARGLMLGCAPDTCLAPPIQTARRAIDDGLIGDGVAASAAMTIPGHEAWHHDPGFYYQPGGGPLFDMGPYYLTALIHLLGPIKQVCAMTARGSEPRRIRTGPRAGTVIPVAVETHVAALLRHRRGAVTTLTMSFDVVGSTLPHLEVYGSKGSLSVPNPNRFDGEVRLQSERSGPWETLPPSAGFADCTRGYGVAEMAAAIRSGREPRVPADVAHHIVDVMSTIIRAAENGRTMDVASDCAQPAAVQQTEVFGATVPE